MSGNRVDFGQDDMHIAGEIDPPGVWLLFGDKPHLEFVRKLTVNEATVLSGYLRRAADFVEGEGAMSDSKDKIGQILEGLKSTPVPAHGATAIGLCAIAYAIAYAADTLAETWREKP